MKKYAVMVLIGTTRIVEVEAETEIDAEIAAEEEMINEYGNGEFMIETQEVKIMNGEESTITFTSEWSDGSIVTTNVIEYNPETGFVEAEVSSGRVPEGELLREYITLEDGTEVDVCMDCHEYVLKTVMIDDGTGNGMHEEQICRNPEHEL